MSSDGGIEKDVVHIYNVVYIYNVTLLSSPKNEIMPFAATWMNLEIMRLSKISQAEKGKYHM